MTNHLEVTDLMAENARLRSALTQFLAACDTAIPTSLMLEIGIAAKAARAALNIKCEYCEKPHDPRVACPEYAAFSAKCPHGMSSRSMCSTCNGY